MEKRKNRNYRVTLANQGGTFDITVSAKNRVEAYSEAMADHNDCKVKNIVKL